MLSRDAYFQAHFPPARRYVSQQALPETIEYGPYDDYVWASETWHRTYARTDIDLSWANQMASFEFMCVAEHLAEVPRIYYALFDRTKEFTTTVRELVDVTLAHAPGRWAQAACMLISWSMNVLRHEKVGFEKFLHSQRQSIYWILDDALLRICLDQWENARLKTPWSDMIKPLSIAFRAAEEKLSDWGEMDYEEMHKWHFVNWRPRKEELIRGYFERSRKFVHKSARLYELWRTMKLWGKGQLPAELALIIIAEVSMSEELPQGDLRDVYLSESKISRSLTDVSTLPNVR